MYIIKLNHMVSDKIHARSPAPTPWLPAAAGRQSQNGGQRFGEMESLGPGSLRRRQYSARNADY